MFLYETHMHTRQGSGCGRSSGKEHAQFYKELGYTGIIITDHFFGGNTRPSRDLPWRDFVEEFCSGYEDAKAEGDRIGLDVFFGWEQGMGHDTGALRYTENGTEEEPVNHDDEYLIYGPDKQWLLEPEEIAHCSRARQLQLIHEAGGCVVQAHPFRWRGYMTRVRVAPMYCDGVEVANAGNFPMSDLYAWNYAKEFGKPMTAGSDNHDSTREDQPKFATGLEKRITDIREYAAIIRAGGSVTPVFPHERLTGDMSDQFIPETYWVDEQENLRPTGRTWGYAPKF